MFFIKEKAEVGQIFQNFNKTILAQFQMKIQVFKAENDSIITPYLVHSSRSKA
uniref:Uncharacterized protein n=1 Tax=Rhizophora mucronata TaxID=61149 RepID=A0A2P2PBE6_RHIMU